jgi:O-antigen/teichoic acid export membrane protein
VIRSLLSHSVTYGVTNIVARGSLLVSLLVLAGILGPTDYGALAMLTLAGNLAAMVVSLQVSQGLARFYGASKNETERNELASSAWWFTVAGQLLFLVACLVFAPWLTDRILGGEAYLGAFRIALVAMVFNALFLFIQGQFRWAFRPRDFVIISLVYSALVPALSIVLALSAPVPIEGAFLGQAVGVAAAAAWGCWRLRDQLLRPISAPRLRQMLAFAAPLVPASLAVPMLAYAPRIALNDLASLAAVGVFAFAAQIGTVSTLAVVGLQAAMTPLVTAHHAEPGTPAAIGRVFEAFCAAGLLLCMGLGLFAADAIAWRGDPAYVAAGPLVMLLAPAALLVEMYIFAPGFWIAKRTSLQAVVCIASGLLAVAVAYVSIGALGLIGAAIGSLASAAVFFVAWWRLSDRFYPVPVRWGRILLFVAATAGAATAALLLTTPGSLAAIAAKLVVLVAGAALAEAIGLVSWRDGLRALARAAGREPPPPAVV